MGDVELVVAYVELAKRELGEAAVLDAAARLMLGPSLPAGLDPAFLDEIPDSPGVYLFYGQNDLPLYIGKTVALRSRVLCHFSGDHASSGDMRSGQEIARVEWIETAGELDALLLEARLIEEQQPVHNRRLRAAHKLFPLNLAAGLNQIPMVRVVTEEEIEPEVFEHLFGLFRSKGGDESAARNHQGATAMSSRCRYRIRQGSVLLLSASAVQRRLCRTGEAGAALPAFEARTHALYVFR